jgi:hypothetical protein
VLKQANYLLLAKHGLAAASRVNDKQEIEDYIELTFKTSSFFFCLKTKQMLRINIIINNTIKITL